MTLGNGLTETTSYNHRLQPTAIRLGAAISTNCANTSGADLLNLSYSYGANNNNGNVQSQAIVRPVGTWTQSYGYDGVNRLTSASESGTGNWSEGYGYDAFGNRWVTNPNGLPPLTNETPQGRQCQRNIQRGDQHQARSRFSGALAIRGDLPPKNPELYARFDDEGIHPAGKPHNCDREPLAPTMARAR